MEEWKEYKLGEVVRLINGRAYSQHELFDDGKYRIVRVGNLSGGDRWFYSNMELSDEKYCEKGDLLYAWACNFGPYIWKGEKTIYHYHIWKLVEDEDVVDKLFLFHYLKYLTPYWLGNVNGSVMVHITKGTMEKFPITLPSLRTQRRIASILSSLDDKIEVNRRINDNLEQQAQALFKSWFVDFEPFKDGEFVESELGIIPKGWKAGSLEDLTTQKAERVGDRVDMKVLSPVTSGQLMLSEEYFTKQVFSESIAKYKVVEIGDFAYNPARVNIGSLGRNNYDFNGCVSPVYVVFSCKDGYAHLFDLYRKTEKFKSEVNLRAIGGVRQSLNYKDFAFIQCIIPPLYVVEEFNAIYGHILVKQKYIGEENDRLASLRDTLLPRLMSGELKVEDVML